MLLYNGMRCPICEIGTIYSESAILQFEYKNVRSEFFTPALYCCPVCKENLLDDAENAAVEQFLIDQRQIIDGNLNQS
jgi:hypothetical protein